MRAISSHATAARISTESVFARAAVVAVHRDPAAALAALAAARLALEILLVGFAYAVHVLAVDFWAFFGLHVHVEAELAVAARRFHWVATKLDAVGRAAELAGTRADAVELVWAAAWKLIKNIKKLF